MVRHRPPKGRIIRGGGEDRKFADKKVKYFKQANQYLDHYEKIMIVLCDNVQSKQMQRIRIALRGQAELLMGKNTMMRKVLIERAKTGGDKEKTMHAKLVLDELLRLNIGFILTNGDVKEIKKIVDNNKIQAPARQGAIAPLDVIVPAGNTGLEPTKTSFFQALQINTKITKGTVEILKDEHIIKVGEKVGSSEATLLQMLGINPFFYGLQLLKVYDQGSVYGPEVLDLSDEDVRNKFQAGISNVTALSLALGIPTKASLPHVIMNGFKNILSIGVGTSYVFKSCNGEALIAAIKEGKSLGGPAPAANAAPTESKPAAGPAKEEKAKPPPPPEEEEGDDMGFGLFD